MQPKAIAFPTDSRLYFKATRTLVRLAKNADLKLRRSFTFVNKKLLVGQGRYARARQFKRARKCEHKLRTNLGRVLRDVSRQLTCVSSPVHREALHGNPYDGHTLNGAVQQVKSLTQIDPKNVMVDRGYRGHDYGGDAKVHLAGRIPKSATRSFRKLLKRKSAIEPTIGHLRF